MGIFDYFKMAFLALKVNRLRSVLTMIGIVVGISAIVTISSLGSTIQETVQNMVYYQSLNTFCVYMAGRPDVNPPKPEVEDRIQYDWLVELQKKYPDEFKPAISDFFGYVSASTPENEVVIGNMYYITDGFLQCNKKKIIAGRDILSSDSEKKKTTAVVADVFVEQYFGDGVNPLGKTVQLTLEDKRVVDFTVVGVYETNDYDFPDARELLDKESDIYIPYETAELFGVSLKKYFSRVDIVGNKDKNRNELKQHLNDFFDMKYIGRKYYYGMLYDVQKDAEATERVVSLIIVIIVGIAAVSLIIAGIGVMNIMLVSISERTKEIGIRKSLGATDSNILTQFSLEALVLCLTGGFIGLLFGILNCNILAVAMDKYADSLGEFSSYIGKISTVPGAAAILTAIGFSTLVGVLSGIYPAFKAARMNPIDALREE